MSIVEPFEDNVKKMFKIEKKRIEKGESWGNELLLPIHNIMTTGTSFMVVETDDPLKLSKYRQDYWGVLDIEVHMIQDFSELRKIY